MMFSFHKPKVYRSPTGCCICKAKSSSSRFTDSKKYEEDFIECFKLPTPRQGEICNACVLLVKRWKKLPVGSNRNWHHVVDARAGPGIKSMTKFKAKNKKLLEQKRAASSTEVNMEELDDNSMSPEAERSSGLNDLEYVAAMALSSRRRRMYKARRQEDVEDRDHVDSRYWSSVILCCGTVYRGPCDEIMIDPNQIKPCGNQTATCAALQAQLLKQSPHQAAGEAPAEKDKTNDSAASSKSFGDASSDSGYDDSSNQGALIVGAEEVAKAD